MPARHALQALLLALSGWILWQPPAHGARFMSSCEPGERPSQQQHRDWTFSFLFENDLFADTDENYTNGIKLSWTSPDLTKYRDSNRIPPWALPWVWRLPFIYEPCLQRNVSVSLGQKIFTPRDIQSTTLITDDRPYAGWLYLGLGFHNKNPRRLDVMEIQMGFVGPVALGEQAQNTVHKLRDIDTAKGWDNQLKNEPGLALIYQHKNRYHYPIPYKQFGADIITHYGGALGNVFTYLNAGIEGRIGWNIPADFGTSLIRPGGDANAPADSNDPRLSDRKGLSLFGFAALSGRLVAHDIFLDGNTFRDSHQVDKIPWVGDLIVGVGMANAHGLKLTYSQVFRTREFETQPSSSNFGSLSISWTFQ